MTKSSAEILGSCICRTNHGGRRVIKFFKQDAKNTQRRVTKSYDETYILSNQKSVR